MNRLWVALKNFPARALPMIPFVSCARYFWQLSAIRSKRGAAAEYIRSRNSLAGAAAILLLAHWETLTHLPSLLRKRLAIRHTRKTSPAEFMKLLDRHSISARELARL